MLNESTINWGIIGCGDVTEIKSGPAFNEVPGSRLVAVMRRDSKKAEDYAVRHGVPRWYSDAQALIADPEVNAVYIATPPSSHAAYTAQVLTAGKPVYVEKPMSTDAASAAQMVADTVMHGGKVSVAHYRRAQPRYLRLRALINENAIGRPRLISLRLHKPILQAAAGEALPWRLDPSISGGGHFHDLAPHQLDILFWIFGKASAISGQSLNLSRFSKADDLVIAHMLFQDEIAFSGEWNFSDTASGRLDYCEIRGDKGMLRFSFFDDEPIELITSLKNYSFSFDKLEHVQQPMIEQVVRYFSSNGENPCTAEDGLYVMQQIDDITRKPATGLK